MSDSPFPVLVSVEIACEILGVSRHSVRTLGREGVLRAVQIGRRTYVFKSDLAMLVAAFSSPELLHLECPDLPLSANTPADAIDRYSETRTSGEERPS